MADTTGTEPKGPTKHTGNRKTAGAKPGSSILEQKKMFEPRMFERGASSTKAKERNGAVPEFVSETIAMATTWYWLNYW